MQKRSKNDVLLTELIIVILVFSLVAVTVVQMFVAAHRTSARSGQLESALIVAQDWAERLSGAQNPDVLLLDAGFEPADGAYVLARDEGGLTVAVGMQPENRSGAGRLLSATVSVFDSAGREAGDDPLVSLPALCYIPSEEVGP